MTLPEYLLSILIDLHDAIDAYNKVEDKTLSAKLRYIIENATNARNMVEDNLSKMQEQNTDSKGADDEDRANRSI